MLDELNYDNKKIVDLVPFKTNIGTDYREQLKQQDLMKSNKIKWEKNNITKNDEIEQHTVIGC